MTSPLTEALGLNAPALIAIVGGGGKTTLMYSLAKELRSAGKSVAAATTTRIMAPSPDTGAQMLFAKDMATLGKADFSPETPLKVLAGGINPETGKVIGIPPALCDDFFSARLADFLIVEADGSRRLPLKAPGPDEPVIPLRTTHFVAVAGLSALGKPLGEVSFRPELVSVITGLDQDDQIDAETIAKLLTDPRGLSKNAPTDSARIIFLNQADTPELASVADKIVHSAMRPKIHWDRVIAASLLPSPAVAFFRTAEKD